MHSPHESHMVAIYRILHYLKSTLGKGILFQKTGNMELEAYRLDQLSIECQLSDIGIFRRKSSYLKK